MKKRGVSFLEMLSMEMKVRSALRLLILRCQGDVESLSMYAIRPLLLACGAAQSVLSGKLCDQLAINDLRLLVATAHTMPDSALWVAMAG